MLLKQISNHLLVLFNLHDCTFKHFGIKKSKNVCGLILSGMYGVTFTLHLVTFETEKNDAIDLDF